MPLTPYLLNNLIAQLKEYTPAYEYQLKQDKLLVHYQGHTLTIPPQRLTELALTHHNPDKIYQHAYDIQKAMRQVVLSERPNPYAHYVEDIMLQLQKDSITRTIQANIDGYSHHTPVELENLIIQSMQITERLHQIQYEE